MIRGERATRFLGCFPWRVRTSRSRRPRTRSSVKSHRGRAASQRQSTASWALRCSPNSTPTAGQPWSPTRCPPARWRPRVGATGPPLPTASAASGRGHSATAADCERGCWLRGLPTTEVSEPRVSDGHNRGRSSGSWRESHGYAGRISESATVTMSKEAQHALASSCPKPSHVALITLAPLSWRRSTAGTRSASQVTNTATS